MNLQAGSRWPLTAKEQIFDHRPVHVGFVVVEVAL